MSRTVKNLTFSAMFLALCMVLPVITGGIPQIGNALSPMHIPVFLCGFICGWQYGASIGFVAPLMRSIIFSKPVMYPAAVGMSFELAAYGLICGVLYKVLPKKPVYIYIGLIISMLGGRMVWGIARYIMAGLSGSEFSVSMFVSGAFTTALPGIICHLIVVPLIIMVFEKRIFIKNRQFI
ncbi:MAG: ECF transporter S component [Clostridia bacterium]|nr:ECF transporter S component [Clostridia bacterium]